jgi:hypothetical protein
MLLANINMVDVASAAGKQRIRLKYYLLESYL